MRQKKLFSELRKQMTKSKLTPTHQALFGKQEDATCWQFHPDTPRPVWVHKKFHRIGPPGEWQALVVVNGKEILVTAHTGDWAVTDGKTYLIISDDEFKKLFRPIVCPPKKN